MKGVIWGGGGGGGEHPSEGVGGWETWGLEPNLGGLLKEPPVEGWGTMRCGSGWGLRIREWMKFGWGFGPIMRVGLWSKSGSKSGSKKRKALPYLFPGSHTHFHKTTPKN